MDESFARKVGGSSFNYVPALFAFACNVTLKRISQESPAKG